MSTLRKIWTHFGFKVQDGKLGQVNRQVGTTKRRLRLATREARKFRRSMNLGASAMKAMFVVAAGSIVVKALTTDYSQAADKIAKFSAATGIGTGFLQKFNHAMEIGGASTEESQKGMQKFLKMVNDSKRGLKTAQLAFKEIGIDPKTITADQEGILKISDAFSKMKDKGKRAAVAQELFGKAGLKLVPGLKAGRVELAKLMEEAVKLGIVMSPKQLAEAEKFNDEMLRAKGVFKGIRNQLAAKLLPALTKLMRRFQMWAREGTNLQTMLKRVTIAAKLTAAALAAFAATKILQNIAQMVSGIMAGVRAIRAMGFAAAVAQVKVALLVAAMVLIPLIIQDLYVFAKGGDSLIGRALGDSKQADEMRAALLELGKELKKIWAELKPELLDIWKEMKPLLADIGKELKGAIPYLIKAFVISLKVGVVWLKIIVKAIKHIKRGWRFVASTVRTVIAAIRFGWKSLTDAINDDTRGIGYVFAIMSQVVKSAISTITTAWEKFSSIAGPILLSIAGKVTAAWNGLTTAAAVVSSVIAAAFSLAANAVKKSWGVVLSMINRAVKLVGKVKGAVGKVKGVLGIGGDTPINIPTFKMPTIGQTKPKATNQTTTASVGKLEINIQGSTAMGPGELGSTVRKSAREALQDVINQAARNFRGATV